MQEDIRPFTKESVDAHKAATLAKLNPSAIRTFIDNNSPPICALSLIFGTMSVVGAFCSGFFEGAYLLSAFFVFTTGLFAWLLFCSLREPAPQFEWSQTDLRSYQEIVPEYVLQTAIDIRREFKDAIFIVEHVASKRRSLEAYDPFLICKYEGEEYYLEVWNEPGFDQKREI